MVLYPGLPNLGTIANGGLLAISDDWGLEQLGMIQEDLRSQLVTAYAVQIEFLLNLS